MTFFKGTDFHFSNFSPLNFNPSIVALRVRPRDRGLGAAHLCRGRGPDRLGPGGRDPSQERRRHHGHSAGQPQIYTLSECLLTTENCMKVGLKGAIFLKLSKSIISRMTKDIDLTLYLRIRQ